MEICKEMVKLRKGLDERGIVWIDKSETYGNDKIKALGIDLTIYRTQFTAHDVWFSVIYGHGTYGMESGLLECMSEAVDKRGEPKGNMTADEILEVIDGLKNEVEDALKSIIDAPITKAETIRHGQWEWEPGYVGTQARCSVCKRSPLGFYSLSKLQIGRLPEYPFCPKCGARMDGDVNE